MATLTPLPLPLSFEDFCALFLLFIAYSTLGWCGEMIYCSVPKGRLCEKRGFLNGFLCPIYGHGALLVLYALRGGFRNPFLTFLFGALLTSALEYFTSWVMEKLENSLSELKEARRQDDEFVAFFRKYGNIERLDRETVNHLIDRVEFTDATHIDIYFKFSSQRSQLIAMAETILSNTQETEQSSVC